MEIPTYQQIKDVLKEEIRQGKYRPGDVLPSVNQLAKMFSTSRNTSVKAIGDLVHEGVVHTIQGKGTVVNDLRRNVAAAGQSSRPQLPNIGVMLADFDNLEHPYLTKILKGISDQSKTARCLLKVFCMANYSIREFIAAGEFDGVIILSELPPSSVLMLKQHQVPFVLANNDIYGEELYSVTVDSYCATYEALKYLHGLGHQAVAVLAGPSGARSTPLGYAAWQRAVEDFGLSGDSRLFKTAEYYDEESGYKAFAELLKTGRRPTAVFAMDDYMALGAIRAAAEAGIRAPEELSVVGCGNLLNENTPLPLTTMDHHLDALGAQCLKMLLAQLGKRPVPQLKITRKPELIIRHSCVRRRTVK
jgi:DNA-binding LacI/PurR family transcriptional regulator